MDRNEGPPVNINTWTATLCTEDHGVCYYISHNGAYWHFQPGKLELEEK